MAKPQQPELRRSGLAAPVDPDAIPIKLQAQDAPEVDSPGGPVPADNVPGHHPDEEQDKPSGDDFVAKVKAKAAEAEAANDDEPEPQESPAPARSTDGSSDGRRGTRQKAEAPTQTSAPKAADRPVAAVTQLTTDTPTTRAPVPAWVALAAHVAGTPFRITAGVLKIIRRAL
jgi:hypothetical protein